MKKILLLLLFPLLSISQNRSVTTLDEYNYLTKGYKIQIESGLDMKKGYELDFQSKQKIDAYEFQFAYFRKTENLKIVAILIIAKSSVSGSTYYFAIPFYNNDLTQKYYDSINLLDERMTTALALATSNFITVDVNKWN